MRVAVNRGTTVYNVDDHKVILAKGPSVNYVRSFICYLDPFSLFACTCSMLLTTYPLDIFASVLLKYILSMNVFTIEGYMYIYGVEFLTLRCPVCFKLIKHWKELY